MTAGRLFFAVRVPEPEAGLAAGLVEASPHLKPVRADGMHLTLLFLGAVEEGRRPLIRTAAEVVFAGADPFQLELAGAGAFPSWDRPRVIWIGVTMGSDRLRAAAESLTQALEGRPAPDYLPHCTLARVAGRLPRAARERVQESTAGVSLRFQVDAVELLRSEVTAAGPNSYLTLERFPLGSPLEGPAVPGV